jgi:hypothetical protein
MGNASGKENFDNILKKLTAEDVNPTDHEFWDELWKTTLTVEVNIIHVLFMQSS